MMKNKKMIVMEGKGRKIHRLLAKNTGEGVRGDRECVPKIKEFVISLYFSCLY
jgi:hypothetical protein